MKLYINSSFDYDTPIEEALKMITDAGFDGIGLGMKAEHSGYREPERRTKLKQLCDELGLDLHCIHAWGLIKAETYQSDEARQKAEGEITECIDACAHLEAPILVLHHLKGDDVSAETEQKQIDLMARMVERAEKSSVMIALENLRADPEDRIISRLFEEIDSPSVGFCYDTSHDNLTGASMDILRRWGKLLAITHFSDNNVSDGDAHLLPGDGTYPWEKMAKVLAEIGFTDRLFTEVSHIKSERYKDVTPAAFAKEAHKRLSWIAGMVSNA